MIEPHGNSAPKTSASVVPARVVATMSELICHSVGHASVWNSRGTRTECGSAMRERSLRSRSTIIRFSARSFGALRRKSDCTASSAGVAPRGAVPFIGRASSRPARQSKNSSGETDRMRSSPKSRYAAYAFGCARRSAANSASASPRNVPVSGAVALTW